MILYKLIDLKLKNDIENNSRISLSRPLFEFGEPEGIVFDFFQDIKTMVSQSNDYSILKPNEAILDKIKKWYMDYDSTLNDKTYTIEDVKSDLRIQMCVYLQSYFGYFTKLDLFDDKNLHSYLSDKASKNLFRNKTHILKIKLELKDNFSLWEIKQEQFIQRDVYNFIQNNEAQLFQNNLVAVLHVNDMAYLDNDLSFYEIFKIFNNQEQRNLSAFYKLSKEYLSGQCETRLSLYLPSYKCNSSTTACNLLFDISRCKTTEEELFYYALSTYVYISEKLDRYVYLNIDKYEIKEIKRENFKI